MGLILGRFRGLKSHSQSVNCEVCDMAMCTCVHITEIWCCKCKYTLPYNRLHQMSGCECDFKFKKKTTLEQLEKLDADIKSIETFRLNTEIAQRRIVGQFILVSAGIYVIVAIVFYFQFFPATLADQIFYITPLLLVPFIILGVKRLLTWYYRRKIIRNDTKLSDLRVEKKKLLDHVMDTETYKVAKTILEKFAPDQIKKSPISLEVTPYKPSQGNSGAIGSTPTTIRNRNVPQRLGGTVVGVPKTPSAPPGLGLPPSRILQTPSTQGPMRAPNGQQVNTALSVRGPQPNMPLPREILPRDRSVLDKMVEYLVGDGPGNRFALICKSCQGHNGMALPEEFEYFAYRCCYCFTLNPARKLRPQAPKLEIEAPSSSPERRRRDSLNSTSSSEKNTESESETEVQKIATRSRSNSATSEDLRTRPRFLPTPMEVEETPSKTDEEKKED